MTTDDAVAPAPAPSLFTGRLRAASVGIVILMTLIAFEAMAVSAALPTAARDLHGLRVYGWAFTGFLIANVLGMVVAGQVSDTHGPRIPLVAGLAAFLTGLILAGSAPWMAQLIAGRVVQGLGGGLIITAIYVIIGQTYPQSLQPPLFGLISSAWVVPSLVGPVVSGALAQHASWRFVFLGLAPFVAVGWALMLPVLRTLPTPVGASTSKLADPRRILRAVGVAAGIAALEAAGQHPHLLQIVLAVAGLIALVWGLRALLPSGTFRARRGVPAPVALRGLLAGAFFGIESIIPLALSIQHGYGATEAGLPLACSGLAWAVGAWWQGRPPRGDEQRHRVRLVRTGMGFVAAAAVLVAVAVQPDLPGWLMYLAWGVAGLGAGLAMSVVSVQLLRYTNDADRGSDSAALQLADATASALTTGLAGVLIAAATRAVLGYTAAFTILALAMAAVAAVAVAASGRVSAQVGVPPPVRP